MFFCQPFFFLNGVKFNQYFLEELLDFFLTENYLDIYLHQKNNNADVQFMGLIFVFCSFCEFLRDGSELASKYQVFSEDESVIRDMLAKFFYKKARNWNAPLILDVVHSGYQFSCSRLNNEKFVLQGGEVSALFEAATKLKYKPLKGRDEFGVDSLRRDLEHLKDKIY